MRINASFDAVQKNVHTFLEAKKQSGSLKPFVRVTMVLTDKTVEQVETFKERWSGLVDSITVQDLLFAKNSDSGDGSVEKFRGDENSRVTIDSKSILDFQEEYQIGFKCPYLYQSLKIHPSGIVSACSPKEAPEVGNLSETSLHDIWCGEKLLKLRKMHEAGLWHEVPECRNCDVPYMELHKLMQSKNDLSRS